jgi:wobble nucleotide-excising tRNase
MSGCASYKSPTSLETDKKVNLIYGLNGTGKSTFSNFLYAPKNPTYSSCIAEGLGDAEVLVYNTTFVRDHFHEADKLNGIFTVSKENSQAEKDLALAEADLTKLRSSLEKNKEDISREESRSQLLRSTAEEGTWEIKSKYYGGDRVLEFCLKGLAGKKSTLFDHVYSLSLPLEKPSKTIESLKKESESLTGDSSQKFDLLSEISFTASHIEKEELFVTVVLGNQDSAVAGLIKNLENGDWVKDGLEYLSKLQAAGDASCPFCQEKTITKAVSDALREYFDESYGNAISNLKDFRTKYVGAIQKVPEPLAYQDNPFIGEKYGELAARHSALMELLNGNVAKIDAKIRNPSQTQSLSDSSAALEELNRILRDANKSISSHNKKLDNKKQELEAIKSEFWSLMRWQYDSAISTFEKANSACQKSLKQLRDKEKSLENNIATLKGKILAIQKTTVNVDAAIESINAKLAELGVESFRIVKHKDSLYRLERSEDKSGDFHSLSEGEKTVISFLYFLERCRGKGGASDILGRRIVVIDDPISSLSHIYVFNVGQMIKSEIFNSTQF